MLYHSRLGAVAALAASAGLFSITHARADISGFGSLSSAQWALNVPDQGAPPTYVPATQTLDLTNPGGNEHRSIFNKQPQPIGRFTASFTYQALNIVSHFGETFGACFVVQNSPAGSAAVGSGTADLGYVSIGNSVAVTLAIGGSNGTTGVFSGGNIGGGATSTVPVSLASGDPINVLLTYDGTFLTETLTDTVTHAAYAPPSSFINIPAAIGGNSAYVGFTASTVGVNLGGGADQYLSNFQFGAIPTPASLSTLGFVGFVVARRRRHFN